MGWSNSSGRGKQLQEGSPEWQPTSRGFAKSVLLSGGRRCIKIDEGQADSDVWAEITKRASEALALAGFRVFCAARIKMLLVLAMFAFYQRLSPHAATDL